MSLLVSATLGFLPVREEQRQRTENQESEEPWSHQQGRGGRCGLPGSIVEIQDSDEFRQNAGGGDDFAKTACGDRDVSQKFASP